MCVEEELCHSEKWLADILHTYLKKVDLNVYVLHVL